MLNGIEIKRVRLQKRRNGYGEYEVKVYDSYLKQVHAATYFTDDWNDAVGTARHMCDYHKAELILNGEFDTTHA